MKSILYASLLIVALSAAAPAGTARVTQPPQAKLAQLRQHQKVGGFCVATLYSDKGGGIVGAKFVHLRTGAPLFLMQIETVPKAFIWVDTPDNSDRGAPHALEHLLAGKGTKGRYVTLLTDMRLSQTQAATTQDFNFYSFSSGAGLEGFFDQLHAWLDALFRADFADVEAERELYHFGISPDAAHKLTLIEEGSVYEEDQAGQSTETYYFELNKHLLGDQNPFTADIRGIPAPMRKVTPQDIRNFYQEHYRLGPRTGFIIVLDPKENVGDFLDKVSRQFDLFAPVGPAASDSISKGKPKYDIHSSDDTSIGIYPFPSGNETDAAAVRVGWKPTKTDSALELKLLQLFFRGLAEGQNSVLYKALVDSGVRELDSGARRVDYDVFLYNSPFFPFEQIEVSGIPGNRISVQEVDQLRAVISRKIKEISEYPDQSASLRTFNELIASDAKAWRRTELIWLKTPPLFGVDLSAQWKEHLNLLAMDPSFKVSLSQESVWQEAEQELSSGKNIWRPIISKFHLLDTPAATASKPSPQLADDMKQAAADRIRQKVDALKDHYHVDNDDVALKQFQTDERKKTEEIDAIQSKIPRPRFTEYPPLTADDDIRLREFNLAQVPVIASVFERPPTIDIGLAFDLRNTPEHYYKYLPLLPRCLDSVGLKRGSQIVSYSELLAEIQEKTLKFSVAYEENAASGRADLVLRTSVTSREDFKNALDLIREILTSNYCDVSNAARLRDLVAQRLAADESFRADEFNVMQNSAYSFLTQRDALFQAVNSIFTRSHWDERLQWKLHAPVSESEMDDLVRFSEGILSQDAKTLATTIADRLGRPELNSLQRELLEYWRRNLKSFPEAELKDGLRALTAEVNQDLKTGPTKTIAEIRELQRIVVNRAALHVDLVADDATLDGINPDLMKFFNSLPTLPLQTERKATDERTSFPVMTKAAKRYNTSDLNFPWHVALVSPDSTSGDMVFYSDLPGYSELDRTSLIKVLSSKIFAADGPQSFFIKTRESGLAYAIWLSSNPAFQLLWNYADRSPDLPALINLLNTVAQNVSRMQDPSIVDYALRQTFSIPRSIYPPATRGIAIAQDVRDGNRPEKVRRFSEAILRLRKEPSLSSEILAGAVPSICGILLENKCANEQKTSHSIFFFIGSEKTLSETEKRLSIPRLLRIWPSDYWID